MFCNSCRGFFGIGVGRFPSSFMNGCGCDRCDDDCECDRRDNNCGCCR